MDTRTPRAVGGRLRRSTGSRRTPGPHPYFAGTRRMGSRGESFKGHLTRCFHPFPRATCDHWLDGPAELPKDRPIGHPIIHPTKREPNPANSSPRRPPWTVIVAGQSLCRPRPAHPRITPPRFSRPSDSAALASLLGWSEVTFASD